jgi:hypothetical protein
LGPRLCGNPRYRFNSSRWKVPVIQHIPGPSPHNLLDRLEMVPSFLDEYNLLGMTRKELEQLIGKPMYASDNRYEVLNVDGCTGSYLLWLEVTYQNDRIKKYCFFEQDRQWGQPDQPEQVTDWVSEPPVRWMLFDVEPEPRKPVAKRRRVSCHRGREESYPSPPRTDPD